MNSMKVVAPPVADCDPGCQLHRPGVCHVRTCMKCGTACWIDQRGIKLIIELGAVVLCTGCVSKPDLILLVKESDFARAVEEAKRHRDAQRRLLAMN
jgi:hypothetical protein